MVTKILWLSAVLIFIAACFALNHAYDRIVALSASSEAGEAKFWLETSKYLLQFIVLTVGGGVIGLISKATYDAMQARRQIAADENEFRKQLIADFIDVRYEASGKREEFLNANAAELRQLYLDTIKSFVDLKEKLSKVYHDVETGKQSLTKPEKVQAKVLKMKLFFEGLIVEFRQEKSEPPASLGDFKKFPQFNDFLTEGEKYTAFLERYRKTLELIRQDLLGSR